MCAWAVNSITSDRRSKHDKNNRFSFELKTTPKVVPTDNSSTNIINTAGGTDGTTSWLPAGPKAVKPEYPVAYLSIPQAALTISNYIKSVGWVLDGATSAAQGNELAVERWWAEIAKEQGSEWLNDQYQFAVSGWALYGEIELNAGYPLAVGDYIVAGIQTDPDTDKTRVARVSG